MGAERGSQVGVMVGGSCVAEGAMVGVTGSGVGATISVITCVITTTGGVATCCVGPGIWIQAGNSMSRLNTRIKTARTLFAPLVRLSSFTDFHILFFILLRHREPCSMLHIAVKHLILKGPHRSPGFSLSPDRSFLKDNYRGSVLAFDIILFERNEWVSPAVDPFSALRCQVDTPMALGGSVIIMPIRPVERHSGP
jgi:hypothetical protein